MKEKFFQLLNSGFNVYLLVILLEIDTYCSNNDIEMSDDRKWELANEIYQSDYCGSDFDAIYHSIEDYLKEE